MADYITQKIGFIGSGNMGGAILSGINNRIIQPSNIFIYDIDTLKMKNKAAELGVNACESIGVLLKKCDIIVLAVKPNAIKSVAVDMSDLLCGQILISIAAGWSVANLKSNFNNYEKIVRVMPNLPAVVGEGFTAISRKNTLDESELNIVKSIFDTLGATDFVDESLMDVVTGFTGSSPAFCFMMIEAMADAAVLNGMQRPLAYRMAAQVLIGSGKMVRDLLLHPAKLKDDVCSPGGTTIEGVAALEKNGFKGNVMEAVSAAIDKSRQLCK